MTSSLPATRPFYRLISSLWAISLTLFSLNSTAAELRSAPVTELAPPIDDGTLTGFVYDAADGTTPVYPVRIVLLDPVTGALIPDLNVSNSADGSYSLTPIPAGDYKVFFNAYGAANHYGDELHDGIPCDAGSCDLAGSGDTFTVFGTENVLNVGLTRNMALSGTVTEEGNGPVPGVSIVVVDKTGLPIGSAAVSNGDGDWVKGVPGPGTYYAYTDGSTAPGYQPEAWNNHACQSCDSNAASAGDPIEITNSDVTGIDFILDPLFGANPLDGMSATDIEVAAAEAHGAPDEEIGHCVDGLDPTTGVNLMSFNFARTSGRPGHEALVPDDQQPEPGERQAIAELWGPWSTAQFRLVDEAGTDIKGISMTSSGIQSAEMFWAGVVDVPNQSFRVAVSGTDQDAQAFDITCSYLFVPQTVRVQFDDQLHKTGTGPYALAATVTNNGSNETFDLEFSNDLGLPIVGSPEQMYLANGESASILVNLDVPRFTSGTLNITVKAKASGVGNPDRVNSGTATVRSERFSLIFSDGFGGDAPEESP